VSISKSRATLDRGLKTPFIRSLLAGDAGLRQAIFPAGSRAGRRFGGKVFPPTGR
jgi:hypothetical protein